MNRPSQHISFSEGFFPNLKGTHKKNKSFEKRFRLKLMFVSAFFVNNNSKSNSEITM